MKATTIACVLVSYCALLGKCCSMSALRRFTQSGICVSCTVVQSTAHLVLTAGRSDAARATLGHENSAARELLAISPSPSIRNCGGHSYDAADSICVTVGAYCCSNAAPVLCSSSA